MNPSLGRSALLGAALIEFVAGAVHLLGYGKAAVAYDHSMLSVAMVNASKAVWLANSANLVVAGLLFAWIAVRRTSRSRALVTLVGLAPLTSAALLYWVANLRLAACLSLTACLLGISGALMREAGSALAPVRA